jgi:thiol-disulfide isomerase/thioredoxin
MPLTPKRPRLAALAPALLLALPALMEGARPVDLTFKDLKGQKARLRGFRGKAVVLNFWAIWCGPCREEMPMFVEMEKEYAAKGVVFVAVSIDDRESRPKIPEFIAKYGIAFPVWTGGSTMDLDDLKLGGGVPATAFLDQEGRIVARILGQVRKDHLKERLDWLTGGRKGPAPDPLVQSLPGK